MSEMTATNMRAPRKARQIINNMLGNGQITPAGLNWLINATDPFHDTEIPPTGFPDVNMSHSIAQTYQYTYSATAPGSGVWDCHVFFAPITASFTVTSPDAFTSPMVKGTLTKKGLLKASTDPIVGVYPGYNAISVPTGEDWSGVLTEELYTPKLRFPYAAATGSFRLVGCGMEVVNTTPELYIGGSVTTYRSPSPKTVSYYAAQNEVPRLQSMNNAYATVTDDFVRADVVEMPPTLQADAQLYPNSRTWGAREGCYIIGTMNATDVQYTSPFPNTVLFAKQFTQAAITDPAGTTTVFTDALNYTNSTIARGQSMCMPLPFDSHGAIFVGLQPQATLQVTVKYFVERVPTISQPELLVLTRPPTPFDPMALEIYSRCMTHLPVACMVKDNPLGEWFNDVMQFIKEAAPVLGDVVGTFVPGASVVGKAVGSVAGMAGNANSNAKARKKAKKAKRKAKQSLPQTVPAAKPKPQNFPQRRKMTRRNSR